jgi:hypothetical protein
MAIGLADAKIPAPLVIRLAPDIDELGYMLPILGLAEGDRLALLLDLVATDRLGWEREAMMLLLAARLAEGTVPPPRLTARVRSLLREPLHSEALTIAILAAVHLDDPDVRTVAGEPKLAFGASDRVKRVSEDLWRYFNMPLTGWLPERPVEPDVPLYTFVRTEPKAGRNDPCPCGSGRKYKKCCADKEQPAIPRTLAEQFRDVGPRAPLVQQQLFERMRPADLEQLGPEPLTTLQVIQGMRKLALHRRWDAAERFTTELAARQDLPKGGSAGSHRNDLAHMALDAGQLDLAERQMALAEPDEREQMVFGAQVALARKAPDALERLEAALLQGHTDDPEILIECAFALLRHTPALGILAARGTMSMDRLLDSQELLNAIGHARDTLGLSAMEPWEELFDVLLEARSRDTAGGREDHDSETDELRTQLRASRDRARRLDEELSQRERQLEAVTGEREKLAAAVAEAQRSRDDRRRVAELEEERQHLRSKIAKLKGEVAEGAAQRAELRRELARSTDEQGRKAVAAAPRETQDDAAPHDAEGDAVESRPRRVLVPQFSTVAGRSLASVPARVAAGALQEAACLAGGDAATWSGAKHMKRAHEILSVRVGRAWRLLFRVSDERLEVLDLIHRSDLDEAIDRLS